jgi:hypothetical protein
LREQQLGSHCFPQQHLIEGLELELRSDLALGLASLEVRNWWEATRPLCSEKSRLRSLIGNLIYPDTAMMVRDSNIVSVPTPRSSQLMANRAVNLHLLVAKSIDRKLLALLIAERTKR